METHIYVLGAGMVLVVARERDHGLVVAEHCCGVFEGAKYLREEAVQPECLLYTVRRCNVFTFSGGQGDNLLPFGGPQDGAAVDEEGVP